MYLNSFDGLGLTQDQLQSSPHPFYEVVPGKQSIHLGWVTLSITLGDASNYRTEMLPFKVVDFFGPYHVILGQPCYVKFMAIPSYTYLKLKIPGPTGVITVEARARQVLDCEQSSIEPAAATIAAVELRELSLWMPMAPLNPGMPPTSGIFKADEDAKAVPVNAKNQAKTTQIGASLDSK
jgi:hypothetical protein